MILKERFGHLAVLVSRWVGSPPALAVALILVALGLVVFGLDATNIAISIVTMALALIIQATQNKDSAAVHAKLDGLIAALAEADDDLARIEDQTEDDIEEKRPV